MLRVTALSAATLALVWCPVADACSCVPYPTQVAADAAGERVFVAADLIVEATVGPLSTRFIAQCRTPGAVGRTIGKTISSDRPITVHRVLKGKAPRTPVLVGEPTTVEVNGCSMMSNSCDVGIESGSRTILVLHRVGSARFRMESYCSLMALRHSTRGRALFGAT